MQKKEIIDILNSLNDRDIVVLLYQKLNCTAHQINTYRKNINPNQVYKSNKKIKRAFEHDELIAALQVVFCFDKG